MNLRRFNIYGPKLFEAGFDPIPLKRESKAPVHDGWTQMAVDKLQVINWASNGYRNCGVGIRCGQVKGLDIDVYDHEMARSIAAWIDSNLNDGTPVVRRYGQQPKFLIPCYIEGVNRKISSTAYVDKNQKTNKIEILAQGQQFVAYGSHPDTGREYFWEHGCMEDIGLLYLPEFAALDITGMLFDYFDELAAAKSWQPVRAKKHAKATKEPAGHDPFAELPQPPPEFAVLKSTVNQLPIEICEDYETWVQVGMGIHHSTSGSEQGYQLFDSWSMKSDKYQGEKETRVKWQSFSLDRDTEETITFGTILEFMEHCSDVGRKHKGVDNVDNMDNVDTNGQRGPDMDRSGRSISPSGQESRRPKSAYGTISAEIREYIEFHSGELVYYQLCQDLGYKTRRDKKAAHQALRRMVENEFIEKNPEKRGVYRPLVTDIDIMTPEKNMEAPLPLPLPLDLGKYIKLLPGSVIVIGGATNAGKTLMAMQMLRDWIRYLSTIFEWTCQSGNFTPSLRECVEGVPEIDDRLKNLTGIRYLNSEMSRHELGNLLYDLGPDGELIQNAVQWVRRSRDFPRAVLTNGITIVDFLQIHKDFYEIGGIVAEMADKIGDGLLVTLIQKKSGEAAPRGGEFALERARLAMMLDYAGPNISSCYLRKVKHPIDYKNNPQGKDIDFRIGKNLELTAVSDLRRLTKKERERVNQQYLLDQQRLEARDDFSNLF